MVPIDGLLQRIRRTAGLGRAGPMTAGVDRAAHRGGPRALERIELDPGRCFAPGAVEAGACRHELPPDRLRRLQQDRGWIGQRVTGSAVGDAAARRRRRGPMGLAWLGTLVAVFALPATAVPGADEFVAERRALMGEVAALARDTGSETGRTAFDPRVMSVLAAVPRHRFVPPDQLRAAYQNRPLPIGHGQTISQPYIVALMTDLMQVQPGHVVLEIGTGSGYQAAVLAELAQTVCTIEIIEPLAQEAAQRLRALGYERVRTRAGDGYYGWEDCGPFDSIIVTAASSHVPPPLVRQLKPGGRMVIPVGAPFLAQHLMLVEKRPDGTIATRQVLPVRFVPLTGRR